MIDKLTPELLLRWQRFYELEPDVGTRLDWLLTVTVKRIAAMMGLKPDSRGKLIEWGKTNGDNGNRS